ncbi:uncharacterized protein LOC134249754, partial [Saccostrea cucullata]|uniref:uncharacterized protein LOC134249754 n=1 Tax=Saccostrea cuccullata TaxID=36930 RepID=UPI002ED58F58
NSDTTQRTVDEIKKQYANIKQRAKEKSDAIRRPVTGGGPKPPSPTPVEAELLSHLEDRPTLCGLSTGHDTEEVILTVVPEEMHTMTNDCMPSTSASGTGVSAIYEIQNDATQLGIVNLELPPSFSSAKTSKRRKTMEEDEIMTMRAEREKYIQESKKFKEEAEFYRVNTMYVKMKMKELHAGKDSEM